LVVAPAAGRILSHCVSWAGEAPAQAVVLAETDAGARFVACTRDDDRETVAAMLAQEPTGRSISVAATAGDTLHFRLAAAT
jgi:acetyl-CoA C-acetyltransferase